MLNREGAARKRLDGGGDDFASAHRDAQSDWYMTDVDARIELHAEVVVDGENRHMFEYCIVTTDRRVETAVVAWFDRKKPRFRDCINSEAHMRTRYPFLGLCRALGKTYPVTPRFFWICGSSSPWEMVEWDINSGVRKSVRLFQHDDITRMWGSEELPDDRRRMIQYLKTLR